MRRRVVVTGLGTVNPCGNDVESSWAALLAGKSGVARITRFDAVGLEMPCQVAAELKGFKPEDWVEPRDMKKLDLMCVYGLAAAKMAWENAGLGNGHAVEPDRCGTIIGTGI